MPDLPGLFRTYPNTGSSVMLPLSSENDFQPTIMICGGGGWEDFDSPSEASCGLIEPMSDQPKWWYTSMPQGRCMVEGILLLDGTVLWINGAQQGAQGFGIADKPTFEALIYNPSDGSWAEAGRSKIARLYHSVALMLLDGTILVTGSNPNELPLAMEDVDVKNLTMKYPTEYRVEKWTPPYLMGNKAHRRPLDIQLEKPNLKANGETFEVTFRSTIDVTDVKVILYHGGFVTHSLHMGQVMVELDHEGWTEVEDDFLRVEATMPEITLAPGPYVIYVLVNGVPGIGQFVSLES